MQKNMPNRKWRLTVEFWIGSPHPASHPFKTRISYSTMERAEAALKRWTQSSHLTIVAAYIGERM